MAPKEDMLPPGWEDLDRYVDRLIRIIHPLPELVPLSSSGFLCLSPLLHGALGFHSPSGDLDYFHFGNIDISIVC